MAIDPVRGRKALDVWIESNLETTALYDESLSKYDEADESALNPEFAERRHEHHAELKQYRDRYAAAAEDAIAWKRSLEKDR